MLGSKGTGPGQFAGYLTAVAFDEKRNEIFVSEHYPNNHIQVFDLNGNFLRKIGQGGTALDTVRFNDPYGIHVDIEKSLLLVANADSERLLFVRTTDDSFVRSISSYGVGGRGKFRWPRGVAMHAVSRQIFVCDDAGVKVFSEDGAFLFQFGSRGAAPGQLDGPWHVAIDSHGEEVYVTEVNNHRVSVFSTSGKYRRHFGSRGTAEAQFNEPRGIVVHPCTKEIIVADTHNHRLQVFDREGRFLRSLGSKGSGDNQFNEPYALCAHGVSGHVAVTDVINYRVHILSWK